MKIIQLSLLSIILFTACDSNNTPNNTANPPSRAAIEPTEPVKAVSACKALTQDDLKKVFPDKIFIVENDRNDPPNIYEALSACTYKEKGGENFDLFMIDLEVRAKPSSDEALRFINSNIEMDYDKKGVIKEGVGDKAYFYNLSMTSGGPNLQFIKNNVYFKMKIMVFNGEAIKQAEAQLVEIAKLLAKKQ